MDEHNANRPAAAGTGATSSTTPTGTTPTANGTTPAATDTTPAATDTTPAAGASRRRLFKRLGIATLIGGLAAGIGFKSFAGGGHGCHGRGGFMGGSIDPAAMDERIERMLKHLYVEIDATDAQKQKLRTDLQAAASDLLPLRGKCRPHARRRRNCDPGQHRPRPRSSPARRTTAAGRSGVEALFPGPRRRRRGAHPGAKKADRSAHGAASARLAARVESAR
jgi:hypothetical protein